MGGAVSDAPQHDVLSDEEAEKLLRQLIESRGDDGALERDCKKAFDTVIEMRLDAAMLALWGRGDVVAALSDDGELIWRTP